MRTKRYIKKKKKEKGLKQPLVYFLVGIRTKVK